MSTAFDKLRRGVSGPVKEGRDAGVHELNFDGANLASGVNLCQLQAGDESSSRDPWSRC
jgi:hypothetical protein